MNPLFGVGMFSVDAIFLFGALFEEIRRYLRELRVRKNIFFLLDPLGAFLAERFKLRFQKVSRAAGNAGRIPNDLFREIIAKSERASCRIFRQQGL